MTELPHGDAYFDAIAFTRCRLRADWDGRNAVAKGCDPVAMVNALTELYIGALGCLVGPHPERIDAYLEMMRCSMPDELKDDGR